MKFPKTLRAFLVACAVLCSAISAYAQGGGLGSYSSPVVNNLGRPIPGANIAICVPLATTGAAVTSNVASLTMSSNPVTAGFAPGMQMIVSGFTGGDTYLNGGSLSNGQITSGFTILSVTSTTIAYSLVHANSTAASNGTAIQEGNSSTSCGGLASVATDPTLTQPISQPLVSDNLGNWSAFALPGTYYVQFYGVGLTTTMRQAVIAGATKPGGSTGQVQYNNGGTFGGAAGITTPDGNNLDIKGPIPYADVNNFGARPIAGGTVPSGTASCTGTANLTFGSDPTAAGFRVGDGITVYGCGASNAMGSYGALTVTPSLAAGETGTEYVVNSPTGGSTWKYKIIAQDKFGAVLAPSGPTTINNGQATLGLQRVNITSLSRSGDKVTVITASNLLSALAAVFVESNVSKAFNGLYSVSQIDSGTQFELFGTPIDTRGQGWQTGDVATAGSGGSIAYYLGNHLSWAAVTGAWKYHVCREGPGESNYYLIGTTKPTGPTTNYQDVQFDDWGSPYMNGQLYPPYIETGSDTPNSNDAICNSGVQTNDPLTTTITQINGTAVTVANAASQTIAGQTAIFDDGPAIMAAANSQAASNGNGGPVYIPPAPSAGAYYVNSFLQLPSKITIWQAGYLILNETAEVDSGVSWLGDWGNYQTPQFGFGAGATIQATKANPGIYINGGSGTGVGDTFRVLSIYTTANNGGVAVVGDNVNGTNFDKVNFVTGNGGNSGDYLSTAVVLRNTTGTVDNSIFDRVMFFSGPDQVSDKSWSPLFLLMPGQNGSGAFQNTFYDLQITRSYWNRRGIAYSPSGGGGVFAFDNMYSQGNITPMFDFESRNICVNCASFTFANEHEDTTGQPVLANLYSIANVDLPIGITVSFNMVSGPGINGALISGMRPASTKMDGYTYLNALAIPNRDTAITGSSTNITYPPYATGGNSTPQTANLQTFTSPVHIPSGHSFYFDLLQPTNLVGVVAAGGAVPTGTWNYAINATGADGGETIVSLPASPVTTTGGNQTVNLTWTLAPGEYSANIYRCTGGSCLASDGTANNNVPWVRVAQHVTGTAYSDTAVSGTSVTIPQVTGTGVTIANKNGFYGPLLQMFNTSTPLTAAAGMSAIRAAAGGPYCSFDGGSDSPCLPIVPSSVVAGNSPSWCTSNIRVFCDSGMALSSGTQYAIPYYATTRTFNSSCTPPNTAGYFTIEYTVPASSQGPPDCNQVGVGARIISGATSTDTPGASTINDAVCVPVFHDIAGSQPVVVTLPTPTTLVNPNACFIYVNHSIQTDTLKATTWTIQMNGAAAIAGSTGISVPPATKVTLVVDKFNATQWLADEISESGSFGVLNNFNQGNQSQVVVSGTEYYITRSDLDMPATYHTAIGAGTTMRWHVQMQKTAAGTGTFQILLKKGTNGSTADTSIVTQSLGTQTAVADNLTLDITLTWTSATAAYWSISPRQLAASTTGFGLTYPAVALDFNGTIAGQTTTTASDKYGLSFISTTGTPTITVTQIQAEAYNVN